MRLNADQTRVILNCVRQQFGSDARVMLFGSRLNDQARGGDVDLLVESEQAPTLRQRALATLAVEQALQLPVDIVAMQAGTQGSAFARIARSQAQPLEAGASQPTEPFLMGNEAMHEIAAIGMNESNLDRRAFGALIRTADSTNQGMTLQ